MKINRREFTGHLAGWAALAFAGGGMSGCTAQSAFDELNTWVPVAITAFDGVVVFVDSVLTAPGVLVDAAWKILQGAISAYVHTTDPTATTLDKVIAALDAVETEMVDIIAQLPVGLSAAILLAAKTAFALLLATLKNIQSRINPTPAPTQVELRAKSAKSLAGLPTVAPAKDTKDFIKKFNVIMAANGQILRVK